MEQLITGNEAIALGAIRAGVKVVTGYPGTPSTGAIASLLKMDLPDTHVEWSVNEKVALDIAAGVAWAGHRVMCTMKMSGVNVAYDSLVSIAHGGCDGGLVIYVVDDPGASAGMVEQDSRGFALMTEMVMLEPSTVAESYSLMQYAFELAEKIKTPVFVRSVGSIANSFGVVDVDPPGDVSKADPLLIWDISRFTKAGSVIAMTQHQRIIDSLQEAEHLIDEFGLNEIILSENEGGLGIIAAGIAQSYLTEGFSAVANSGFDSSNLSILKITSTNPLPTKMITQMLKHCGKILIFEELDPYVENQVYVLAQKNGFQGEIIGKLDSTFKRVGQFGVEHVVEGLVKACGLSLPLRKENDVDEDYSAPRPITVCAGCPHRGTYMAIITALQKLRLKKRDVMVTGDIGCTILGMNPPFEIIWNEISMGASVSLAQGYVYAGTKTPVIATIGDSTFFHGGIPGLINAIQNQVNMTLIIMDNRWTAMTGMQINPGTPGEFQKGGNESVDIQALVKALGVKHFRMIDPFDQEDAVDAIKQALEIDGVKVILARQECAIQAQRRGEKIGTIEIVKENCNLCKLCIIRTGCPALSLGEETIEIDPSLCYGCGMCVSACKRNALVKHPVKEIAA